MQVETVTVQREKSEDNPSGLVVINKEDVAEGDVVVGGEAAESTESAAPAATEAAKADTSADASVAKQPWAK